jgi:arylsulfatase A-like enzyme
MRAPIALALLLCAAGSCERGARPARPSVILICLDTVRADHLGCYGYAERETTPRLDALAAESTQFLDASATACWTKPSVPSFLTGTYPVQHGVYEGSAHAVAGEVSHALPSESTTLAEVFERAGFATAAFVRNAQLRKDLGFGQGFELYQEEAGDAREIRWRAQDWIDTRADERPFFLYLHLLDAHWPWPVPDEYASRFAPLDAVQPLRDRQSGAVRDEINDGKRELSSAERETMIAVYDGSLRYIDDQLGELVAWLERRGLWEDTIVCIVADHGEEFGEHGKVGHGHGLYEGLLRVPWVLHVPGRKPERIGGPVSLIDLFPTLLAAAHVEAPAGHEGIDRLAAPAEARPILAEHKEPRAYQQSLRSGGQKLVRRFTPQEVPAGLPAPIVGRRYDIEVLPKDGGGLRAVKVKPSADDVGDPTEIKGRIAARSAERFELSGIPLRVGPSAELYGEVPAGAGQELLADGLLVKVVVSAVEGQLEVRRVKVYAPDAGAESEVRGDLAAFEGSATAGQLSIGGLSIAVDAQTHWKDVDAAGADLAREEVLEWLTGPADGARFELQRRLVDLAADPGELQPPSDVASDSPLDRWLDSLLRDLASRRAWRPGDEQVLDAEHLQALRGLGY